MASYYSSLLSINPVSEELSPLSLSVGTRHTSGAYTYMQAKLSCTKSKINLKIKILNGGI